MKTQVLLKFMERIFSIYTILFGSKMLLTFKYNILSYSDTWIELTPENYKKPSWN